MALQIDEIAPDDTAALEARYDVLVAQRDFALPYDPPPSRIDNMTGVANPFPGEHNTHWLVRSGADVVGVCMLSLPVLDNLENAVVDLVVHPAHRRRGIATEIVDFLGERARAKGRRRLIGEMCSDGPVVEATRGNAAFADSCGAKQALDEVRRRLDVAALDRAHIEGLLRTAEAASTAYHLVPWRNHAPEEVLEGIATLESRMVEDAPMGDLTWEPEKHDAQRMRDTEAVIAARGRRSYGCASVHTETGEVTGFTMAAVDGDVPQHAWQWTTIVLPWHRGHRLGLRLKCAALLDLMAAEPEVRAMDTWNAEVNGPMIAVNELMGYRPLDKWSEWQLELG